VVIVKRDHLTRRAILGAALAAPFASLGPGQVRAASAPRIVSLDLLPTELLLTLGIAPVAAANVPLYQRLVARPVLPEEVNDLGPLTEPNAEYLQFLKPDAIVMASWQAGGLNRLADIAPLVPLDTVAGNVPAFDHMAALLGQIGSLAGREAEARQQVQQAHDVLLAARAAIETRSARPLYVCRFSENGRNVAVFGGNGLIGDVLRQLGLKNAWQGRVNASGVVSVGIDQLAGNPEARIVHFDRGPETARALERLAQSALWRALPAVRAGRVTMMPVIYPSGGVLTAMRFARQLADGLPHDN
jgi:ABC-type Fe3+-hydroxamate transport system substrate-binding protein